jgi:glutamyl-tRNA reductase
MTTEPAEPAAAVAAVCADAEEVRRRELSTALGRLEAGGELPEGQREAVERMTEAIVAGLLADPVQGLAAGDRATAGRALGLFDIDTEPRVDASGRTAGSVGVSADD